MRPIKEVFLMRMKRATYKMDKEKQQELRKKLIKDDMSFNEFVDRVVCMYLEEVYTLDK